MMIEVDEVNQLLRDGFMEADQSWRERSRLESVDNFGEPLTTTSRMIVISEESLSSGEYREHLRESGRNAAERFLKIFVACVGDGRASVVFLNGMDCPHAETVEREDNGYVVRGYHDFGICRI